MKAILLGSIGTVADTSHMQLDAFNLISSTPSIPPVLWNIGGYGRLKNE